MEIRKAFLAMIKAFPGGWDAMASALGFSRDGLENRIYERKGQGVLVETAMQMQKFASTTHFAEAVSLLSGGTFVKLPDVGDLDNDAILSKMNQLHIELGQWHSKFAQATADNEIDRTERAQLEDIAGHLHRTLDELKGLTFRLYCKEEPPSSPSSRSSRAS